MSSTPAQTGKVACTIEFAVVTPTNHTVGVTTGMPTRRSPEGLPEEDVVDQFPVRAEGPTGDDAHLGPARGAVERFGAQADVGGEMEEGDPPVAGHVFDGPEQG